MKQGDSATSSMGPGAAETNSSLRWCLCRQQRHGEPSQWWVPWAQLDSLLSPSNPVCVNQQIYSVEWCVSCLQHLLTCWRGPKQSDPRARLRFSWGSCTEHYNLKTNKTVHRGKERLSPTQHSLGSGTCSMSPAMAAGEMPGGKCIEKARNAFTACQESTEVEAC